MTLFRRTYPSNHYSNPIKTFRSSPTSPGLYHSFKYHTSLAPSSPPFLLYNAYTPYHSTALIPLYLYPSVHLLPTFFSLPFLSNPPTLFFFCSAPLSPVVNMILHTSPIRDPTMYFSPSSLPDLSLIPLF